MTARIPASACRVVGLKPSRGRVSIGPACVPGLLGNIVEHVITRSVRDTAAILDAIAGPMPGDPFTAPPPARPYRQEVGQTVERLRIGLLLHDPVLQLPIGADCLTAVTETSKLLELLGHHVEEAFPPALLGPTGLGEALRIISASSTAARLDTWSLRTGHQIGPDDVESHIWATTERGRTYSAVQVHAAVQRLVAGVMRVPEWWVAGFDLLVTPTMQQLPPKIGEFQLDQQGGIFGLFAMPYSITGQPAISLPLHWSAEELPVGVQFVADYGREDLLIRLSAILEEAKPWAAMRPRMA